jgi:hypothetical protein
MSAIEHMNNDHAEAIHLCFEGSSPTRRVLAIDRMARNWAARACGWNSITLVHCSGAARIR